MVTKPTNPTNQQAKKAKHLSTCQKPKSTSRQITINFPYLSHLPPQPSPTFSFIPHPENPTFHSPSSPYFPAIALSGHRKKHLALWGFFRIFDLMRSSKTASPFSRRAFRSTKGSSKRKASKGSWGVSVITQEPGLGGRYGWGSRCDSWQTMDRHGFGLVRSKS